MMFSPDLDKRSSRVYRLTLRFREVDYSLVFRYVVTVFVITYDNRQLPERTLQLVVPNEFATLVLSNDKSGAIFTRKVHREKYL